MSEKNTAEQLREALCYQRKNGYHGLDAAARAEMERFSKGYREFLTRGKTERACVAQMIKEAEQRGFHAFSRGEKLAPGDKIYACNRDKALILAVIGTEPLERGVHIAAAPFDEPCIHLKQYPL